MTRQHAPPQTQEAPTEEPPSPGTDRPRGVQATYGNADWLRQLFLPSASPAPEVRSPQDPAEAQSFRAGLAGPRGSRTREPYILALPPLPRERGLGEEAGGGCERWLQLVAPSSAW
jgi:hypothetical protein